MIKKTIVTGGAGFIGSNLVNRLLEIGVEEIIILDNLSTGTLKNVNSDPKVKLIQVDISDSEELNKYYDQFIGTDVIFHLAAKARVQPSIKDPVLFNKNNVDGTLNMLVVAKDNNIKRFVYSASSSAYGNAIKMPLEETMPTSPMSPYGLQKLIGEEYCKLFSFLYNIETVSLRYFNVFGENQPTEGAYCTVIGIFSNLKKEGKPLTIVNDGEQRRDMTYVGDVVLANILSATSDKVGKGEVINIGSGKNYSVNQLADIFDAPKVFIGNVIEPKETLADNSKAKELLGWSPTISVIDWLEKNIK